MVQAARHNHPRHAQSIRRHAEGRGKKGFVQQHLYLSTRAQGREQPLRLGIGSGGGLDRQRDAFKHRLAQGAATRCHQRGLTDAKASMHHLVLGKGGDMPGDGGSGLSLKRISTVTSAPSAVR